MQQWTVEGSDVWVTWCPVESAPSATLHCCPPVHLPPVLHHCLLWLCLQQHHCVRLCGISPAHHCHYLSASLVQLWSFAPEAIDHGLVNVNDNQAVSCTVDANQLHSDPNSLDINYKKVSLILIEIIGGDCQQLIDKEMTALVYQQECPQPNNASLREAIQ